MACSIAIMLVMVLNIDPAPVEATSRWILKSTDAGAAVLGSWEWLAVETDGYSIPYLNVAAASMIVVGIGAGIGVLAGLVPGWWERLRN